MKTEIPIGLEQKSKKRLLSWASKFKLSPVTLLRTAPEVKQGTIGVATYNSHVGHVLLVKSNEFPAIEEGSVISFIEVQFASKVWIGDAQTVAS